MKIETKPGLWVDRLFTEKFGNEEITPAKSVPPFKVLPRAMTDAEIKQELGVEECTLADVAAFLENPPKVCKDGYWNLFYVAGRVVFVRWNSDVREWGVSEWFLGNSWDAGYRAFSRNGHSESLAPHSLSLESLSARLTKVEETLKHHNI